MIWDGAGEGVLACVNVNFMHAIVPCLLVDLCSWKPAGYWLGWLICHLASGHPASIASL